MCTSFCLTPPSSLHTLDRGIERAKLTLLEAFILQVSQKRKLSGDLIMRLESPQVSAQSQWEGVCEESWKKGREEILSAWHLI